MRVGHRLSLNSRKMSAARGRECWISMRARSGRSHYISSIHSRPVCALGTKAVVRDAPSAKPVSESSSHAGEQGMGLMASTMTDANTVTIREYPGYRECDVVV